MFRIILFIIFLFFPASSWGAVLYLLPQSQTVWQGDSFIAEVWLDSEGQIVNSVEGYLNFPQDKLQIIDISQGGSILSLWLQNPSFSGSFVSFAGGVPNGFSGQGRLFSITFSAIPRDEQDLSASVEFQEDSRVFLHDGQGTPASLSFFGASYESVKKPENLPIIFSSSHPNENKWYADNNFDLRWDLTEGAEYSYLLSFDFQALPDEIADRPEGSLIWQGDMAYKGLPDGIYYFHLRQSLAGQWTPKITRRAMIDLTPPESFQPEITEIEGKNYLVFSASDDTSGIDYYEVQEDSLEWRKAQSPYLLADQKLQGKIQVRAVDKAGNETLAEYASAPFLPQKSIWRDWMTAAAVLAGAVIILLAIKYLRKPRNG